MSELRTPAGAPESISERFFWFVTAFATLALGGLLYVGYIMFFPPQRQADTAMKVATASAAAQPAKPVDETPVQAAVPASSHAEPVQEVKPETPPPPPPLPAVTETKPAAETQPDPAPAAAELPVPPKKDEPEVNPYMVPQNKPFLTHDMFEKKPPPRAAAALPKPKVPGKPEEKPKAAPVPPRPESIAVSTAASLPVVRGKIYVLKDGRRIPAVSTVDLGDSYGVKDLNSSYITIPKADVSEVVNR